MNVTATTRSYDEIVAHMVQLQQRLKLGEISMEEAQQAIADDHYSLYETLRKSLIEKGGDQEYTDRLFEMFEQGDATKRKIRLPEGILTLEQLNLIMKNLPVDISFVDEHDIVCFYNDTESRVFPRSPNMIGKTVQECHPQKSVEVVNEIIENFREHKHDRAVLWINKPGVFIYILYLALYDEQGNYRGILEMMQNCEDIRDLEGSHTELTWTDKLEEEGGDDAITSTNAPLSIEPETKLKDLLARYPQLKKDLPKVNPVFNIMKTPLFKTMLPKATVQKMADRSGMELSDLTAHLKRLIDGYEQDTK